MARHEVRFLLPWRRLGKEDVVFRVAQDDELLGTLKVSKGAVVWWPGKAKLGFKMDWERFDALMREQGRRGRYD
jgi:hypothetical protein